MSQSHLSTNLDKIIQLISIEQIMGLMKQMKTGVDMSAINTNTNTNNSDKKEQEQEQEQIQVPKFECVLPDKMNEQLEKINNTLLLIVDKISSIESEIQTLKECKQRSKSDANSEFYEEHIILKIEEKDVPLKPIVDNLNLDDESVYVSSVDDEDLDIISEDACENLEEDNKDLLVKEVTVEKEEEVTSEEAEEEEAEEEAEEEEVEVEEVEVEEEEVEVEEDAANDSEKEISDESEEEIASDEDDTVVKLNVKDEQPVVAEVVAVVNLEEDEEVFEIEIDDITYYATHEENGILYEVDKDGEVGKKVGIIKDGEPIFS
jgi:hypothetical protein